MHTFMQSSLHHCWVAIAIYIYIYWHLYMLVFTWSYNLICFTSSEKTPEKKKNVSRLQLSRAHRGRRRPARVISCWWKKSGVHQVEVGSLSHYLQGFIHPRWLFGISSIKSTHDKLKYSQLQKSVLLVRVGSSDGSFCFFLQEQDSWLANWWFSGNFYEWMVHAPNVPMEFYEWQAWILTTLQLSPFEPPMLCLNKTHLEYFKICWKMKVTFMAFHHGSGIYKHWIHWRLEGDSWFVSQLGPAIEQGKSMHNIWYTNMFFSSYFLIIYT